MVRREAVDGPVHPGAYVRQHVLPEGMTVTRAAEVLGIGRPALSNFLNGRAALSQEMARRLERAFGADRERLLDLQTQYDRRDDAVRAPVVAGRHAPTLVEIRAARIEKWADTTGARDKLPALLRRLICTTGDNLARVDFPAFDNAQRPGLDGEVETMTPTPWIPDGRSIWEFSCDRRPRRKANGDYAKRVESVPQGERRDATFVFVTPRNWQGGRGWADGKSALREWRDVRAYDAGDLEQWLEQSAETQIWFAERLGIPVSGYRSPDMCWSNWADTCEPALSPALFSVADGSATDLQLWLDAPPAKPFIVSADSPDEALAFACHLVREAMHDADQPGAGALVFDKRKALQRFRLSNAAPHIAIIHNGRVEREIGNLCRRCHCIIVRPANDAGGKPDIRLGLPGWRDFSDALESMDFPEYRIKILARESGRSPTVLRRRLSNIPAIREPAWSRDAKTARKLLPATLIGAWSRSFAADRECVRLLTRTDNDDVVEKNIEKLLNLPDSPVWSTGKYWGTVSRIDSLFGISKFVTDTDLDNFFSIAEHILSEADPALELPVSERWAAQIHGKMRVHSAALRGGIREMLVLLSVHGNTLFGDRIEVDLEARVSSLIQKLLTPLTINKLLSYLNDLPAYAEAAPNTFLEILEADLRQPDPVIFDLLKPVDSGPFGSGQSTTGLLCALECLGWKHLARVSLILATLSRIPIDDNLANRPIASLGALYRAWLPQTSALLAERMQSLETLTKRFPDVGWQVCIAQWNMGPQMALPCYRPRWRDDASGPSRDEEFHEIRLKALSLVLAWPNHDQRTLGDLVERLHGLPDEARTKVWDLIDAWAGTEDDDTAKASLRERIRRVAFTRRGRRHGMQGKALDRARVAYDRLEPRDPVVRHCWLFAGSWIEPDADEEDNEQFDHHKRRERVASLRAVAMKEIWEQRGFEGVAALLAVGGAAGIAGQTLEPHITDQEVRIDLLNRCLAIDGHLQEKAEWFLREFLWSLGDGPRGILLAAAGKGADVVRIARLYSLAPFRAHTWRLLDSCDPETRDRYWRQVEPRWDRYTEAELTELTDRLLEAKRPRAAFSVARFDWPMVETSRLKRLVAEVGTTDVEPVGQYMPESCDISNALAELDSRGGVDGDEMVRLEFMYIRVLDHSTHGTPNLERRIAESPIDFVRILALLFERDDGGQDPPEWRIDDAAKEHELAIDAQRLLARISYIPGTGNESSIDVEALSEWIAETRRLCAEYGRAKIGDQYVGQLLSRAPADDGGGWPHLAICEAMERGGSSEMALGFAVGAHNQRGVVSRAIGEGGAQERELAQKYRIWAKQRSPEYPYVGSILEGIATDYDRQAQREDDDAHIGQRLGR